MKKFLLIILLSIITLITYINILPNNFAWDDPYFFVNWPQIQDSGKISAFFSIPDLLIGDLPLDHRGVYRPIRSIYYLLSYKIWGQNPLGYHLQAIAVHILIVIVIYLIIELITKKNSLAFIVSILFATHPIHTEAVTYMTASMDTLGILFFFISFYCFLRMKAEKVKSAIYLFASLLYAFLAFFTYEMTLTLPIIIVLYDFCLYKFSIKKITSHININIYKYYFLLLLGYSLIRFVILGIGNRADYLGQAWTIAAYQARVGQLEIIFNYLGWLIWPSHLSIAYNSPIGVLSGLFYFSNKIDPSGNLINLAAKLSVLFPIIYFSFLMILAFIFLRKFSLIFFAVSFFLISLLPAANIVPQGAVEADRFLYLPSFGFCLLLGLLIYQAFLKFRTMKIIMIILLIILTAFYMKTTINRNKDWLTEESLWLSAIREYPDVAIPYGALGALYVKKGEYDQSIKMYQKGITLSLYKEKMLAGLGIAYEKKGSVDQAIDAYKQALKENPGYSDAHDFLGNLYQKQNNFDLAISEYQKALKSNSDSDIILTHLGTAYFNKDQYQTAIEYFNKALMINPRNVSAYVQLAHSFSKLGDNKKALDTLRIGFDETNDQTITEEINLLSK